MQQKLFQLSGIVFVALVLVSVIGVGGSTPGTDASADELASFYGDHALRQGLSAFALAAAVPFLVFFGIGVATALGSHGTGDGVGAWGYVLLTGTTLVACSVLVASYAHFALANGADEDISPTALQALNSLDGNSWVVFNSAFGVLMLGAAGTLLAAGSHRWLGWVALPLGVAAFVPFADFFALLATLAWIVVAAIVLARATPRTSLVAATEAA